MNPTPFTCAQRFSECAVLLQLFLACCTYLTVRKFTILWKPKGSLSILKTPTAGTYHEPAEFNLHLHTSALHFNIILLQCTCRQAINKNSRFQFLLHFIELFLSHSSLSFSQLLQFFSGCVEVRTGWSWGNLNTEQYEQQQKPKRWCQ
jgi:hypothetical protein